LLLLAGCAAPGLLTDGTSVSVGTFSHGILRHGAKLPVRGEGYLISPLWAARESSYGTDELVTAIEHAARRVHREYPGASLQIGDLSTKGGGDSVLHRSHENGRDADLIYYALDPNGRPAPPADSMPRYFGDLRAHAPGPQEHGVVFGPFSPRTFDVARNWALVRALLEETQIEVQYLFINERLKQRLLDWARAHGEDEALLDRAQALMKQPGDSAAHDDHLHVRIFCSADDRPFGCADRGPIRWWKKRYKYMPPAATRGSLDELTSALTQLVAGRTWRISGFVQ
jgi:penicillin-insensitive murein endopeptidase